LSRAQSSLEYMLIVAIIVAGLLSMSVYIKRAQQGNFRQSADQLGGRYDPKRTISDVIQKMYEVEITTVETDVEKVSVGGRTRNKLTSTTNAETQGGTSSRSWEQVGP
jgi:cytoskeletal protein RodZ